MNPKRYSVVLPLLTATLFLFCFLASGDQSNESVKAVVDSSSSRGTRSLQVVGNDLFVAAWGYGIQVLDISDPTNIRWKGSWNPRRSPNGIQVVGNFAFVADRIAGLTVLDVTDTSNPSWVTTIDTPGDALGLQVVGTNVYVADACSASLLVFNISNARTPQLIQTIKGEFCHYGVQVAGNTAYINSSVGLKLLDIDNPNDPKPRSAVSNGVMSKFGMIHFSQVVGSVHYVPCGRALEMFDTKSTELLGTCLVEGAIGVFVRDTQAFVMGVDKLSIIDVTEPRAAKKISSINLEGTQRDVVVAGNFAYLMDSGASIRAVEMADIKNPQIVGFFPSSKYSSKPISISDTPANNAANSKTNVIASKIETKTQAITNNPPELSNPTRSVGGIFSFVLAGVPNGTYAIQASVDLTLWVTISTNALPDSGVLEISDNQATNYTQRYYRAVMQR